MVTNSKKPLRSVPSAKNHDASGAPAPSTSWAPLTAPLPKSWMKYIGRSATMPTPLVDLRRTETPAEFGADAIARFRPSPPPTSRLPGDDSSYTSTVFRERAPTERVFVVGLVWPSTSYSMVTFDVASLGLKMVRNSKKSGSTVPSAKSQVVLFLERAPRSLVA